MVPVSLVIADYLGTTGGSISLERSFHPLAGVRA